MQKEIKDYLEKLLARHLAISDEVFLSSAQRARFLSWCSLNNFPVDAESVAGKFTISGLRPTIGDSPSLEASKNLLEFGVPNHLISKVGIDLQSVSEFFPESQEDVPSEFTEIFTKYELNYASLAPNPNHTLTGIFSLKEALIKAGAEGQYLDLEITHDSNGSPIFPGFAVSISHSGDYVSTIAISFLK